MQRRKEKMPTQKNLEVIDLLRQINDKQDAQLEKINELHTKQEVANVEIGFIKQQTTKTNGRVTKLEDRSNFQRGGLYVAYVLIVIGISIVALFIK